MKKLSTWACAGLVVSGLMVVAGIAIATMPVNVEAASEQSENPLRVETFIFEYLDGTSEKITRIYDTETGFVCYRSNWNENSATMGPCRELRRSNAINERYGVN